MNWTWIADPLTAYVSLAIGLAAGLLLFYSAKKEMARLRRSWAEERKDLQDRLQSFQSSLDRLHGAVKEAAPPPPAPETAESKEPPPISSIQQSKRSQALRMYRRGETAEQISNTLHMPKSEVELLLKVHKAVAGS